MSFPRLAWLEGRSEEALELSATVVKENPWLYDAHILSGEILHARGRQRIRDGSAKDAQADLDQAGADVRPGPRGWTE